MTTPAEFHNCQQLAQWLDSYCDQGGVERALSGKILDYIEASSDAIERLQRRVSVLERLRDVAQRRIVSLESGLSEAVEIMVQGEKLLPKGEARFRAILEGKEPT